MRGHRRRCVPAILLMVWFSVSALSAETDVNSDTGSGRVTFSDFAGENSSTAMDADRENLSREQMFGIHIPEPELATGLPVGESMKKDVQDGREKAKSVLPKSSKPFGPGLTKIKSTETLGSVGAPAWRVFFSLLILIGLIVLTLAGLRKLGKRFGAIPTDPKIKMITRMALDTKNSLVLVRVYEQEMLLGVSSERINLLSRFHTLSATELDEEDESGIVEPGLPGSVGKIDGLLPSVGKDNQILTVQSLKEL